MNIKICLFFASGLILSLLAINHSNATSPLTLSQISDSDSTPESSSTEPEDSSPIVSSDTEVTSDISQDAQPSSANLSEYEVCYVGRYLHTKGNKTENTESHHLISAALCKEFGLNIGNAPAILLPHRLHKRTGSHGSNPICSVYHELERQLLYEEIQKKKLLPKETPYSELKKEFRLMSAQDKFDCLKPVLTLGVKDLAWSCKMPLFSFAKCEDKLDVELRRLSGKQSTGNPLFTPSKQLASNIAVYRRKSNLGLTSTKAKIRPRKEDSCLQQTADKSATHPSANFTMTPLIAKNGHTADDKNSFCTYAKRRRVS